MPGKLFGPDGCSEQARGEAVPAPGFTTNTRPLWVRSRPQKDAWPGHLHREDIFRHATRCGPGQFHRSKDECPTASVPTGSVSAWSVRAWWMACRRPAVVHGDLPVMIEDGATLHNLAQQRQSHVDAPLRRGVFRTFRVLAVGSQNARGTPAARAAKKKSPSELATSAPTFAAIRDSMDARRAATRVTELSQTSSCASDA